MKRFGPFSLVCCLLLALGILFSGFGFSDSGKTAPQTVMLTGDATEDAGENFLSEPGGEFYVQIPADAGRFPHLIALSPAPLIRMVQPGPAISSGWMMPPRI